MQTTSTAPTLPAERRSGLRERKKAERRLALVDAAHRLVEEHGFEHVTVEDIAAAAGVSPRTFFNYFETKDDAIVPFLAWPAEDARAVEFAAGGPTGDLVTDLDGLLECAIDAWREHADRIAVSARLAARHPQLFERRVAGIERYRLEVTQLFASRAGRTEPGTRDVVGALGFVHLLRGAISCWEADPTGPPPSAHLPRVRALLREIAADPGP